MDEDARRWAVSKSNGFWRPIKDGTVSGSVQGRAAPLGADAPTALDTAGGLKEQCNGSAEIKEICALAMQLSGHRGRLRESSGKNYRWHHGPMVHDRDRAGGFQPLHVSGCHMAASREAGAACSDLRFQNEAALRRRIIMG